MGNTCLVSTINSLIHEALWKQDTSANGKPLKTGHCSGQHRHTQGTITQPQDPESLISFMSLYLPHQFHKGATQTNLSQLQAWDSLISKEEHQTCSGSTDFPSTEQMHVQARGLEQPKLNHKQLSQLGVSQLWHWREMGDERWTQDTSTSHRLKNQTSYNQTSSKTVTLARFSCIPNLRQVNTDTTMIRFMCNPQNREHITL